MLNIPETLTLASQQQQAGNWQEAERLCRQILQADPQHAEAHNCLGLVLLGQSKPNEAATSFRQALRCKPDYSEARRNQQRADLEVWKLAVQFMPNFHQAHCDLGDAYAMQGQLDLALASYERALRIKPDCPETHRRRAILWLLQGDFERGWVEYEWRWRCREFAGTKRSYPQPEWDGSPLAGRTILLHTEQGFGDMMQFVRYAPLVKERGGRVIVECHPALVKLLTTCPGVDAIVPEGSALPAFDVYISLLSVPRIVGTTLATIPANVPYLFADPELVKKWQEVLSAEMKVLSPPDSAQHSALSTQHLPLRIGITWQGNLAHRLDVHRSIPLRSFAPLGRLEGVRLFSLQKGPGVEQIAEVANEFSVTDLGSRVNTFMETAAVMKNLDLIVTADTSVAHCAGAVGVPVWVALSTVPEMRWLLEREDSPWYPTMRLFRQRQWGEWEEVFERMAGEVLQSGRKAPRPRFGGEGLG